MPLENGIWTEDEAAQHHAFDYFLARWVRKNIANSPFFDFGCGPGHYVEYFNDTGLQAVGFEGTPGLAKDYVLLQNLAVPFTTVGDGNVLCLEVGEHIPEQFLSVFLSNITKPVRKGGYLVLSWAVPGQEGIGHVSCRPNEWVVEQMNQRGLHLDTLKTDDARLNVSNHCAYFRDTLLVFKR